jgi:tripartite-type tricarboxylate transporter receptor subunit TctC
MRTSSSSDVARSVERAHVWLLLLLALWCLQAAANAEERFPAQGIEIIIPYGPGGGQDLFARSLAPLLEKQLGVAVFATNVAGHAGNAALTKLLVNPPDGYSLAVLSSSTVAGWALGTGYARPTDFTVLGILQDSPNMLYVPNASPYAKFGDVLGFAKANPARFRVATGGTGTIVDLVLKRLDTHGYKMVNIPFANPQERNASLARGRADAVFEEPGSVAALGLGKEWRPLVVFDARRDPRYPDVPAIGEFELTMGPTHNSRMLVVPAKTPVERVRVLANAIAKAVDTPEWKAHCAAINACVAPTSPEEATASVRRFYDEIVSQVKSQ